MKVGDYVKIGHKTGIIAQNGVMKFYELGMFGREKIVATRTTSSIVDITIDNDNYLRVYITGGAHWIADGCSTNDIARFLVSVGWT